LIPQPVPHATKRPRQCSSRRTWDSRAGFRCKVHSRPCRWSARTAVSTCASSPSSARLLQCSGFSTTSASRPSRRGSARPAGRPRGTTRPSRPYPTGTPWRNRHRSTSSTSGCSGSPLPSPGHAGDPPPLASAAPAPSDAASPPGTFPDGGLLPISPRRLARRPCRESSFDATFP